MALVDTNVVSELVRPKPNSRVLEWAGGQQRLVLSVITVEEIWFGIDARRSARLERWFERFLADHCDTVPVDVAVARRAARLRAAKRDAGRTCTQADMLIAATAAEHDHVLVTRNVRDFEGCGIEVLDPFASR